MVGDLGSSGRAYDVLHAVPYCGIAAGCIPIDSLSNVDPSDAALLLFKPCDKIWFCYTTTNARSSNTHAS